MFRNVLDTNCYLVPDSQLPFSIYSSLWGYGTSIYFIFSRQLAINQVSKAFEKYQPPAIIAFTTADNYHLGVGGL